jgi:hypothetical protein
MKGRIRIRMKSDTDPQHCVKQEKSNVFIYRLFTHSPKEEAMERTAAILLVTFFLFSNQRSPIEKRTLITEFHRRIHWEGNPNQCTKSWVRKLAIFHIFFSRNFASGSCICSADRSDYMHENVEY